MARPTVIEPVEPADSILQIEERNSALDKTRENMRFSNIIKEDLSEDRPL